MVSLHFEAGCAKSFKLPLFRMDAIGSQGGRLGEMRLLHLQLHAEAHLHARLQALRVQELQPVDVLGRNRDVEWLYDWLQQVGGPRGMMLFAVNVHHALPYELFVIAVTAADTSDAAAMTYGEWNLWRLCMSPWLKCYVVAA